MNNKLKQKPTPAIRPRVILHVCKVCGWVGHYDELDRGEIGTYGYSEEPKCPRCHSNI